MFITISTVYKCRNLCAYRCDLKVLFYFCNISKPLSLLLLLGKQNGLNVTILEAQIVNV